MPELITPSEELRGSFLEAVEELRAEGLLRQTRSAFAAEIRHWGALLGSREGFARYLNWVRQQSQPAEADAPVPFTTLWWAEGATFLGRLTIRHRLDEELLHYGGHIGYMVRPTSRQRGHATGMLRASLVRARELGLGRVLVTCDEDNVPSRKVIEACGGVFEDQRQEKLRYWIETG
ncbi:GNAT family N-acetyltransferase [Streptomyces sp. NPDC005438]|uniref:GNAT family N-acetyltransferase n=1 Tax=Streptomyces sp. NPDC005438 TaxID=3156880 RepID=UPI0033A1367D